MSRLPISQQCSPRPAPPLSQPLPVSGLKEKTNHEYDFRDRGVQVAKYPHTLNFFSKLANCSNLSF